MRCTQKKAHNLAIIYEPHGSPDGDMQKPKKRVTQALLARAPPIATVGD